MTKTTYEDAVRQSMKRAAEAAKTSVRHTQYGPNGDTPRERWIAEKLYCGFTVKQVGIDRDCIEFREQRKQYQREAAALRRSERYRSIRNWFFTPCGALVYFGIGYGALIAWFVWVFH